MLIFKKLLRRNRNKIKTDTVIPARISQRLELSATEQKDFHFSFLRFLTFKESERESAAGWKEDVSLCKEKKNLFFTTTTENVENISKYKKSLSPHLLMEVQQRWSACVPHFKLISFMPKNIMFLLKIIKTNSWSLGSSAGNRVLHRFNGKLSSQKADGLIPKLFHAVLLWNTLFFLCKRTKDDEFLLWWIKQV